MELLIVVVVIAILAAITIVAFNGIQDRAQDSAVQASVDQANKKILTFAATNNESYPSDQAAFLSEAGVTSTAEETYEYFVSQNLKNYCVGVYSTINPELAYARSNTSAGQIAGRCIRNHALNPSFETSAFTSVGDMGGGGTDSSRAASAAWASAGTQSNLVTKTVATGNPKGTRVGINQSVVVGDVVNWKATIRNNAPSPRQFQLYGERGSPTYGAIGGSGCQTLATGAIQTISGGATIVAGTAGSIGLGVLPCGANTLVGESHNIDGFVITVNQPLPVGYADGTSPGWAWDGAPHVSSSFGPALTQ